MADLMQTKEKALTVFLMLLNCRGELISCLLEVVKHNFSWLNMVHPENHKDQREQSRNAHII